MQDSHSTPTRRRQSGGICAATVFAALSIPTACGDATRPPAPGSIRVTAVTVGDDPDPNGYVVTVDSGPARYAVETSSTVNIVAMVAGNHTVRDATTLTGVREGTQNVWLRDIADNCAVAGPNPQQVVVSFDQPATAAFAVTCVSTQGTLQITTVTTGADPDPDGYTARIAWGSDTTTASLPTDGTTRVAVTARTGYDVHLVGVAGNCDVNQPGWPANTRRVDLAPGRTTATSFAVACEAIPKDRLAPGGQLAFVRDGRIYRVSSDGTGLVRPTDGPSDFPPAWSPDGRRIAFTRRVGTTFASDIYIMDSDGSNTVRRLTGGATLGAGPTWSPDGKHIAFDCFPNTGSAEICVISADDDGTGAKVIAERPGYDGQPAWSPDGSRIAFVSDWAFGDVALDIFVMTRDGSSVTQLTDGWRSDMWFRDPAWSSDGRKIAVVSSSPSDPGSATRLLLLKADGSGGTTLTTTRVAWGPAWSPDGRTIAFATRLGIERISPDGGQRGLIVADGRSPSWRQDAVVLGAAQPSSTALTRRVTRRSTRREGNR